MIKRQFISFKLLFSYFAMLAVIVVTFFFIQKEYNQLSNSNANIQDQNLKMLELSQLIATIYETDQKGKKALQSNTTQDFLDFEMNTDSVKKQIDVNKKNVFPNQISALDTLKLLIDNKKTNISKLIELKFKAQKEPVEYKILKDLSTIESHLGKLTLDDFIKNPYELNPQQRKVAQEFVDYLNENIPNESKNIDSRTIDSLVSQSKIEIEKSRNIQLQRSEKLKENEILLLRNDLELSKKIADVMSIFEQRIIQELSDNNQDISDIEKSIFKIIKSSAIFISITILFFFIIILIDVFKMNQMRKKLEHEKSQKDKLLIAREQMIATISHDIKNPLTQIILHIDTLLQGQLTTLQNQYLNRINAATLYIHDLLNDLLEFAKIQSGKIQFQSSQVCVYELVEEIVEIHSQSKKKDVEIIVNIKSIEEKYFDLDALRYKQVLINLLNNAIKFTEKGHISIQVYFKNNHLITNVVDTGVGFNEKAKEVIFDEFTQVHENLEKGGTGLGLSICKKIIEALGGEISVESKENQGSTFTFSMPTQIINQVDKKPNKNQNKDLSYLKILLVDDDEMILKSTANVLKKTNAKLFTASNGLEALEILNQNSNINLLVTDIQMPKMNGYELLNQVRTSEKFKTMKVISLSGANQISELNATQQQFDASIKKPYLPTDLIQMIASLSIEKEIIINQTTEISQKKPTELYSLDRIQSFIGNEPEEMMDYLLSFIENMNNNIVLINKYIDEQDIESLKFMVHKINSNWKMMQAKHLTDILDELENNSEIQTEEYLNIMGNCLEIMEKITKNIQQDHSLS